MSFEQKYLLILIDFFGLFNSEFLRSSIPDFIIFYNTNVFRYIC